LSALVIVATILVAPLSPHVASAVAPVPINGTGSSFASPALRQWSAQTDALNGVQINFAPSSSVQGLNEYAQGLVNFAASDIGYSTGQANFTPGGGQVPFQYMPDVGGALTLPAPRADDPLAGVSAPAPPTNPTALVVQPSHLQEVQAALVAQDAGVRLEALSTLRTNQDYQRFIVEHG